MGMDQYYRACRPEEILSMNGGLLGIDFITPDNTQELAELRNQHEVHAFWRRRYHSRGGESEEFNTDPVQVLPEDLEQLAALLIGLDEFGYKMQRAWNAIGDAKVALSEGKFVFYTAWF